MSQLLEAELLKLRTTRTFLALVGAAVGISLLVSGLVAGIDDLESADILSDVYANDATSLFILVLAVVGITGEWRHRTITSSLLAMPDRTRFLAAKTLAFAAAGVVLSLTVAASVGVLATVILTARDLPTPPIGDLLELALRKALVAALLGAFGVVLGGLVRNQMFGVTGVLVLLFIVDGTITALAPEVARFSPFGGLPAAITELDPGDSGFDDSVDLLSPAAAALAMLAWIAVLFAAAATLLRQRDLT